MILQRYPVGEPLATHVAGVDEAAGEVLGLHVHADIGDGLVAVHAATQQAALVASLFLGYVAVKILQAPEQKLLSTCNKINP